MSVSLGTPAGISAQAGGTKAEQLKKQLYHKDAKLVDLFGDLEPKMMLDSIINTFWEPWQLEEAWLRSLGGMPRSQLLELLRNAERD